MNDQSNLNGSQIIASLIDIPSSKYNLSNLLIKIDEFPLGEIEIELDTIEFIEKISLNKNKKITVVINYPLGGYQEEYIFDSIQWACEKNVDIICTSLPFYWLRSNEIVKLKNFLREIINCCGKKTLRFSIESDVMSREEISKVCDLILDAGISNLKSSCGFTHRTSIDDILFIKKHFPDLLLTIDNNLEGNAIEIDHLFQLGVNYVCLKEPWLYHF